MVLERYQEAREERQEAKVNKFEQAELGNSGERQPHLVK